MRDTNREFAALVKASGLNQTKVAALLFVEPPTISRYCSGAIACPAGMLEHFKLVLATENPAALGPSPREAAGSGLKHPPHRNEFGEMNEQLVELKRADPKAFATVRTMLSSVHAQVTAQPRANSAEAVAMGEPSELDVAGVPRPPAAPAPRSATAAPSAHRRAPVAPARSRSSAPPATPKPAPVEPAP